MEELEELKRRLEEERPMVWDSFPDIGLYMDQVISYVSRQLISYDGGEALTPAMVNNYIKDGLLPRADGKKYSKTHLGYLTAICALKQVLSVRDTRTLLENGSAGRDPEKLYAAFYQELSLALDCTAEVLDPDLSREDLPRLALRLALRSYADKLACQRILSLIAPQEEKPERRKK
ncbi:DUF1836 domain-containing protein [Intestinimonas timonensis]|uniref:DUF1836 domain-containing protein n=1 Tax=Intestinimonas timonensis TaxID=1689270 RepID=UPI003A94C35D